MLKVKLENNGFFKTSDELASGYDVGAVGYARVVCVGEVNKIDSPIILKDGDRFCVKPNETIMIKTGVYLELPTPVDKGEYYLILEAQMRGRSGLSLKEDTNVKLGTIDNNYRGECNVIFKNEGDKPFYISKYDRVGQVVFNEIIKFKEIEYVIELSETDRMDKGFGSTGK